MSPGHEECLILDPATGHRLLFIEVPDPTPGRNKTHFDLRPTDRTQQEETDRLLADPEGNLFCVLKSDGEIAADR